ncbi:MAG: Uma2 family endonuclease [Gemmatimonadaceae bacterium]
MAQAAGAWTLADLDRLPDDGNRYELIAGELFVTPAPSPAHEVLATVLKELLDPYVRQERLGRAFLGKSVIQTEGSQVEPDLMVRQTPKILPEKWPEMPLPILVVEVLSAITRRRDHVEKRAFYLRNGVAEYWIVNRWDRTVDVVTPNADDVVVDTQLTWHPNGASSALDIDVAEYFRSVLG